MGTIWAEKMGFLSLQGPTELLLWRSPNADEYRSARVIIVMRLHLLPGSSHALYAKALVPSLTPLPHFPAGIVATIPDQGN